MTIDQNLTEIIERGFTVSKNGTELYKTNRKKTPYEIFKRIQGDNYLSEPSVSYVTYGENEVFENFYNAQNAVLRFLELSKK